MPPSVWVIAVLAVIVICGALSLKFIVRDEVRSASTAAVREDRSQSNAEAQKAATEAADVADADIQPQLENMTAAIEQTRKDLAPVLAEQGRNTVSPSRQAYIESLRRRHQEK